MVPTRRHEALIWKAVDDLAACQYIDMGYCPQHSHAGPAQPFFFNTYFGNISSILCAASTAEHFVYLILLPARPVCRPSSVGGRKIRLCTRSCTRSCSFPSHSPSLAHMSPTRSKLWVLSLEVMAKADLVSSSVLLNGLDHGLTSTRSFCT